MTHRIHWRNRITGRTGVGPKEFTEADAKHLADQLNDEYPEIEHQAVPISQTACFAEPIAASTPVPTRLFTPLRDNDPFPDWGVHGRQPMRTIPASYLDWLRGQEHLMKAWPELADYIDRNKQWIAQELERAERERPSPPEQEFEP